MAQNYADASVQEQELVKSVQAAQKRIVKMMKDLYAACVDAERFYDEFNSGAGIASIATTTDAASRKNYITPDANAITIAEYTASRELSRDVILFFNNMKDYDGDTQADFEQTGAVRYASLRGINTQSL